jgi:phosphatidylinositol kinase/protein kinase (PI-3  family)
VWKKLFSSIQKRFPFEHDDLIAALCYQNWMETLLQVNGWKKAQRVIVLLWQGSLPPKQGIEKNISVRKMKLDDLPKVVQIDDLSFSSFWKFSSNTITMSFEQSAYSTVAELDGKWSVFKSAALTCTVLISSDWRCCPKNATIISVAALVRTCSGIFPSPGSARSP